MNATTLPGGKCPNGICQNRGKVGVRGCLLVGDKVIRGIYRSSMSSFLMDAGIRWHCAQKSSSHLQQRQWSIYSASCSHRSQVKRTSSLTNISCWLLHLGLSELGWMDAGVSKGLVKGCIGGSLAWNTGSGSAIVRNIGLGWNSGGSSMSWNCMTRWFNGSGLHNVQICSSHFGHCQWSSRSVLSPHALQMYREQ